MENVCDCTGNSIVLLSSAISIILAKDLNSDEQNLLGNFLQAVGQNLEIISSQTSYCANKTLQDKYFSKKLL